MAPFSGFSKGEVCYDLMGAQLNASSAKKNPSQNTQEAKFLTTFQTWRKTWQFFYTISDLYYAAHELKLIYLSYDFLVQRIVCMFRPLGVHDRGTQW